MVLGLGNDVRCFWGIESPLSPRRASSSRPRNHQAFVLPLFGFGVCLYVLYCTNYTLRIVNCAVCRYPTDVMDLCWVFMHFALCLPRTTAPPPLLFIPHPDVPSPQGTQARTNPWNGGRWLQKPPSASSGACRNTSVGRERGSKRGGRERDMQMN